MPSTNGHGRMTGVIVDHDRDAEDRRLRYRIGQRLQIVDSFAESGPSTDIIGAGGTPVFGGMQGSDEWNPKLKGRAGLLTLEKMVASDPTVSAGLLALLLPILAADWKVTAASDSARDKQIAEFVSDNIFNMRSPFGAFTSWFEEMLEGALVFGHFAQEKIWSQHDGKWFVDMLAPRPPKTLDQINVDDAGKLTSVTQNIIGASSSGAVDIPADKLVFSVRKSRGGSLLGTSVLRAAYKPWFIKKELEVISAIAFERRAMGVDVGTLEAGDDGKVTVTRRRDAETALMGLHAREKQYITETPNFKYRVEGLRGSVLDPSSMMSRLTSEILRSMLAEALAMGEGGSGSLAMHRDKTSFFTLSLNGHAQIPMNALNWQLIPDMVRFNYGDIPDAELPFLEHGPIDTRDFRQLSLAVSSLMRVGALTPDREIEAALRTIGDLPALAERQAAGERMRHADSSCCAVHAASDSPRRVLRAIEKVCDFRAMNADMDRAIERIVAIVTKEQEKQVESIVKRAGEVFKKGTVSDLLDIEVTGNDRVASAIESELMALFKSGRKNVRDETRRQEGKLAEHRLKVVPPDPSKRSELEALIALRAKAMASIMSAKLSSGYQTTIAGMARRGDFSAALLSQNLGELSSKEITKAAGLSVSEALNLGRKAEFADNSTLYKRFLYTTQGDTSVCQPCLSAEQRGESIPPGSDLFDELYPPFAECEGGDRCRCQMIGVLSSEAAPGA